LFNALAAARASSFFPPPEPQAYRQRRIGFLRLAHRIHHERQQSRVIHIDRLLRQRIGRLQVQGQILELRETPSGRRRLRYNSHPFLLFPVVPGITIGESKIYVQNVKRFLNELATFCTSTI
jgi:hypothetical protein